MRPAFFLFPMAVVCCGQAIVQQAGPRAPQPNAQPAICAADGYVVNGLTGEPIPRARIGVYGPAAGGAVADNTGRWKVTGITCGRLSFSASRPGFLQQAGPGRLRAGSDTTAVASQDSPAHDVRIELIPQAVVLGKVIDEAGDPVPNATVTVFSSRVTDGRRFFQQGQTINSNDLGEYRIAALPPGKIILCAHAPIDFQALEAVGDGMISGEGCYPGPVDGGSASALSLPAGREARVDFTLSRVPAVRIRGKVTGMPERGGVSLMLMPRNGARATGQGRPTVMQRDGTFEARGIAAGAWMLSVDYWEGSKRLLAHVPVDVTGTDVEGVVVRIESALSLTGTLRVESQSGQAANVQQVNVSLRGADPISGGGGAQWDKNHTAFTINDTIPGSYWLSVNVPAPFYVKSAILGGRDMMREAIPIMQSSGPVEVILGDDAGSVQGRIEDSNGEGVAAWVMVWQEGRLPVASMSSPEGRFKVSGLAPGDYRVFAWDDFQQVEYGDPDWMRRNGGGGVAASVTRGQAVDLKLVRAKVPVD